MIDPVSFKTENVKSKGDSNICAKIVFGSNNLSIQQFYLIRMTFIITGSARIQSRNFIFPSFNFNYLNKVNNSGPTGLTVFQY